MRRVIYFSKKLDPKKWDGKSGFMAPNWGWVRWLLTKLGFTIFGLDAARDKR